VASTCTIQQSLTEGWLSAWTPSGTDPYMGANGLIDFAGSGVVHMTGGGRD